MTTAQKVIKYVAVGLAAAIIVSIVSAVYFGGMAIISIFGGGEATLRLDEEVALQSAESLDIEIFATKLQIVTGNELKLKTNNKYISTENKDGTLKIKETKKHYSLKSENYLVLYIPKTATFSTVKIETGAGEIELESLSADKLRLDLGAGSVDIESINISEKAEINGGAGELNVNSGSLTNLDMDLGVGAAEITASVEGNSKVDCGIGEVELNLKGTENDYKIMLDKGIGEATVNGVSQKSGTTLGGGKNLIDISGGIGEIDVNFVG